MKANERILTFKENKTEILTLEELQLSQSEVDLNFPPHYEIIDDIQSLASKFNLKTSLGNLYIHKGGISKYPGAIAINRLEEKFGKGNIQSFLIRRVLGMLYFTELANKELNYSLAINKLQDGLQVAMGHEVKICSNMTILSYDNMLSSFGNGKANNITYNQILEHLEGWFKNIKDKAKNELAEIKNMKAIPVNHYLTDSFFGKMYRDIMNPSYKTSMVETDVKQFQRDYLTKIDFNLETAHERVPSLWDFVNLATEVVHPTSTDPYRLLKANVQIINYIRDQYNGAITKDEALLIE
jgi:hypothetical protein